MNRIYINAWNEFGEGVLPPTKAERERERERAKEAERRRIEFRDWYYEQVKDEPELLELLPDLIRHRYI